MSDKFGVTTPDEMGLELRLYCKKHNMKLSQFLREAIEMRLGKQDDLKTMIQNTIRESMKSAPMRLHPPSYTRTVTETVNLPPPPPAYQKRSEFEEWQMKNIETIKEFKSELFEKMEERRKIIEEEELAKEVIIDG
jgi:hypothetical protein